MFSLGTKSGNCFDHIQRAEAQKGHRFEVLFSTHDRLQVQPLCFHTSCMAPQINPMSEASLGALAEKSDTGSQVKFCVLTCTSHWITVWITSDFLLLWQENSNWVRAMSCLSYCFTCDTAWRCTQFLSSWKSKLINNFSTFWHFSAGLKISMASLVTIIAASQTGECLQFAVYENLTFSMLMIGQPSSFFQKTSNSHGACWLTLYSGSKDCFIRLATY